MARMSMCRPLSRQHSLGAENALQKLSDIFSVFPGQTTSLATQANSSFQDEYVSASLGLLGQDAFTTLATVASLLIPGFDVLGVFAAAADAIKILNDKQDQALVAKYLKDV